MPELQRYEPYMRDDVRSDVTVAEMRPCVGGEWCLYADVEAELTRLRDVLAQLAGGMDADAKIRLVEWALQS